MDHQNKPTQNRSDTVSNWRDKSQTNRNDDFKTKRSSRDHYSNRRKEPREHYTSRHHNSYNTYNHKYKSHVTNDEKKEFSITDDEFPELGSATSKSLDSSIEYLEKCKKKKEEDAEQRDGCIDTSDPQYWDGYRWKGPMFLKSIRNQPNDAKNIRVGNGTLYSRDNHTWFPSWEETFTETEWDSMEFQEHMQTTNEVMEHLADKYQQELEEAYDLYYETNHINLCLQTHFEGIEYEKYASRVEQAWNEIDDITDTDDFEEEDYLSDDSY